MSRRGRRGAGWRVAGLALAALLGVGAWLASSGRLASLAAAPAGPPPVSAPPAQGSGAIAALGRLEPKDGVRRIAGPAQMVAVVGELLVDKRDLVRRGQVIARLDETALREAELARAAAQLRNSEAELARHLELHKGNIISDSKRDELQLAPRRGARGRCSAPRPSSSATGCARPIDGQVLEVHARDGERVGRDGIVELGRTAGDVRHRRGLRDRHRARARSASAATVAQPGAAAARCAATVERIGLKVGKLDVLGTDPAARTDARVVEVEIRLDDASARPRPSPTSRSTSRSTP